jgi:hypothetical protein
MKEQSVNEISHRRFCRMDKNYMNTDRGQVVGTARLTALKIVPKKLFSSDHNSNLKLAILGT